MMLVSFAMATNQFMDTTASLPLKDPIVYACFAIVLFAGPGKLSIDALLFPTRRPAAATPPPLKD